MADGFDAYHQWLGISPKDQPPHHYRLLGIDLFEPSADVIEHAADRQMAHIRSQQTGKHAAAAQQLLNDIALAKVCLLSPVKKATYDEHLRAAQGERKLPSVKLPVAQPLAHTHTQAVAQPLAVAQPVAAALTATASAARTTGQRAASSTPALLAALIGGGVLLLLLAGGGLATMFFLRSSPTQTIQPSPIATVIAAVETPLPKDDTPAIPPVIAPSVVDDEKGKLPAASNEPAEETAAPAGEIASIDRAQPAAETSITEQVATDEPAIETLVATHEETAPTATRSAVPDKATRETKRREIEGIFRLGEAKTQEAKLEAARQLLTTGNESDGDTAAQFALYNAARETALQAGDVKLAFEAVNAIEERFDIDALAVKIASLEAAAKSATTPEAKAEIVPHGLSVVDELVAADDYEKANEVIASLQTIARRLRDRAATTALTERKKGLTQAVEQFAAARAAIETLKTNPDDAAANLAAGRYYTFAKGDHARGFALLAQGSDAALQKIAQLELAEPTDAAEQAQLADAWWTAAQKLDKETSRIALARAAIWYQTAQPLLAGLAAAKAAARIKEVQEQGINIEEVAASGTLALNASATGEGAPRASGGGRPTKSKPALIQPGLVTRVYHGQPFGRPTNLLAVTKSSDDFAKVSEQAQPAMRAVLGEAQPQFVAQGFIYLEKQAEVHFKFFNANCKVNGVEINRSNGDVSLNQLMPAGLHPIAIYRQDHGRGGPNFKVTLAETGDSVLVHRRDQLQVELSRPVTLGGRVLAGQLLGDAALGTPTASPAAATKPVVEAPPAAGGDEAVEDRRGIEWVSVPADGKLSRAATLAEFPFDADDRVVLTFLAKGKKGEELGGRKLQRELAEEDGKFRGPLTQKTKKYYLFRVRTDKQQAAVLKSETFTAWGHSTVEVFVNFQPAAIHGQIPLVRGENVIVVKQNHDHSDRDDRSWIKLNVTGEKLLQGY